VRLHIGTSGYSYKEWKGRFYPDDLPAARMLAFYAERFGAVEINNTFYRMPKKDVLVRWSEETPSDFQFALKAAQRITHRQRLKDAGDALAYLLDTAAVLGAKLGPLLFQLPPFLEKDVPRLREFLALLPGERRAAFEFRHASWHDDEVHDALHARGAALCVADTEADDPTGAPIVATADWGYLRLRRCAYDDAALASWRERIAAQPWAEAHVYFKHEDTGTGPDLAARFAALAVR
jgi:uncharacterized protein YecE (DUF72 family)